ncbi:MAG: hypothetical protein H6810_10160 [Phycisphaeraceae bacterium]|nr:MAG: hypothetical protein H6810_10160 [Phycisphaeraceae bacterium]
MSAIPRLILGRLIPAVAIIAASGVAGLFGLELMRSRAEREIYRDRLADLTATYESLADHYNTAVRRTALTELVVEDGNLRVVVQSAGGQIAEIPTPFDPSSEIYVDYAVIGGRVWIRRVFDEHTPPSEGVVIDPAIASIDWNDDEHEVGKAIYRSLGEGRWIVTVAGNGALGLRKVAKGEEVALGPAPAIDRFEVIQDEARRQADDIDWRDLLAKVLGQ